MARGIPAFGSDIDPGGAEVYLGAMGDSENELWVAVLPLDVGALMADACAKAGRNLTREEWSRYMPADADYQATCEDWPIDNW